MNGQSNGHISNSRKGSAVFFLFALFSLIWTFSAEATTYYISPSGSDTAAGSSAAPWASFSKAWGALQAGDTLIVKNGIYSNAAPPSGKAGTATAPITVMAEQDGGATINGQSVFKNNSYITLQGLKFVDTNKAFSLLSAGTGKPSHHLTFQRISFNCTSTSVNDNACFSIEDGSNNILLEDSWGWGGARYTVMCYGGPGGNPPNLGCDNNTFRRLVLRMGPGQSSSGNPQAGISLYYASNNLVENVMVIDSQANANTDNSAFYLTSHAPPPNNSGNKYYGVIALNSWGVGLYMSGAASGANTVVKDSVFWGSSDTGISFYQPELGCTGTIIDHVTISHAGGDGLYFNCSLALTNSIIKNSSNSAVKSQGSLTYNYNDFYSNSGGLGSVSVNNNNTSVNPNLQYIARVESNGPTHALGSGGTDIGANIVNRYQDGTPTGTALWPWPNEDRIKKEMCTDSGVTRGFCGAQTLTKYIWEYLGNPIPAEIYGANPAPAEPKKLRLR